MRYVILGQMDGCETVKEGGAKTPKGVRQGLESRG